MRQATSARLSATAAATAIRTSKKCCTRGPATAGSIAPNVKVKPETGNNFDAGAKFSQGRVSGGAYLFVNQHKNFVAQDLAVAATASGPLAQATNYADVRIGGVELSADAPLSVAGGVLTLSGSTAFTRGTITKGTNPLDGSSLNDKPADNITPVKIVANARFTEPGGHWWVDTAPDADKGDAHHPDTAVVAVRRRAGPVVTGRLHGAAPGWGLGLSRRRERLNLTFAIENLTDRYYREQFQFAPSRGRTFTVGISTGAF